MRTGSALLALAFLFGFECQMVAPGVDVQEDSPLWEEVPSLLSDWDELGFEPIESHCLSQIQSLKIRTMSVEEWFSFGLCPCMPEGIYLRECSHLTTCATGTYFVDHNDIPHIYVSDGEDSSGHRITVRHELAHIINRCNGGSPHHTPELQEVVWYLSR